MKTKLLAFFLSFGMLININGQTGLDFTGDANHTFVLSSDNSALDITQGTIEAWIKTSDPGATGDYGYRGIIVKHYSYSLYIYNNELVTWDNGISGRISSETSVSDNQWHHVALVFDDGVSNGSKFYVDGVPVKTITYNCSTSNENFVVGQGTDRQGTNGIQHFNGQIDNVRVWNTVRSDAEILANYYKCLTGNENGLVLNWKFEEGAGLIANDSSGNGITGTLQNMSSTNWVTGYNCETQNLVAHYPFNGNANDESGNNLNGTVNGPTLSIDRFGNPDSAYSFDGNDIITIPHNDILNSSNELSFSVWVKPNNQQDAMILGKSNYVSKTNYLLRTNSSGFISFEYKDFANSNSLPLTVNDWNHIAVISQTDNSKLVYINGVLATHTTASSPYGLVTNPLTIGAASYSSEYFNGSIDDVRIYKSALTQTDVLNLFNNNTLGVSQNEISRDLDLFVSNNLLYFSKEKNTPEIEYVSVFNILAQEVYKSQEVKNELNLDFLDPGVYILKAKQNNGQIKTLKFIINY